MHAWGFVPSFDIDLGPEHRVLNSHWYCHRCCSCMENYHPEGDDLDFVDHGF